MSAKAVAPHVSEQQGASPLVPIPMFEFRPYALGSPHGTWAQVMDGRPGKAYRFLAKTETHAFYTEIDLAPFVRCVDLNPDEVKDWKQKAQQVVSNFENRSGCVLEITTRNSKDSCQCNVLQESRDFLAQIVIGDKGFDYVRWIQRTPFMAKNQGKPCFVVLGSGSLWEAIEVMEPFAPSMPVRVEIARRTALIAPGLDSVLPQQGLTFISDETKRREHGATILRIETELDDRDPRHMRECAVVAEALLFLIGKQRIRGGKRFGHIENDNQLEALRELQDARLEPLIRAFSTEFEKHPVVKDEMKWIPGALLCVRGWGEESRHEPKDDRQLLDSDGFTPFFVYGALREFVRLLTQMHKKVPEELCPNPMPQLRLATA